VDGKQDPNLADFTSNDYLGLARCPQLLARVKAGEGNNVRGRGGVGGSSRCRRYDRNSNYSLEL